MLKFQMVSSDGPKFDDETYEVLVPTKSGVIALFEDHMPLISVASAGVISVRKKPGDKDEHMDHFAVTGGIIQVDGKTAHFISDDVTAPHEVSEAEAAAALARAEELMKSAKTHVDLSQAKHMIRHRSAQLHVARLKRRHHH